MRQPKRQTINHAYQKKFRIFRRLSHCIIDGPQGLFQSLKVSKSLSDNVDSHFWLSIIKLNWTFSRVSKDCGFGNCNRCCQFHSPKNLGFSKSFIENCLLGLVKSVTKTPNESKYSNFNEVFGKVKVFQAMKLTTCGTIARSIVQINH